VQILRDTKEEVERWTGYTVDFHFANIYRADVYNVLVAGGFGTPTPPVRPTFSPQELFFPRETVPVRTDCQVHQTQDHTERYLQEPIVSERTPFFHVDLIAAVGAAEKLGLKAAELETRSVEDEQHEGSQGGILFDLQI